MYEMDISFDSLLSEEGDTMDDEVIENEASGNELMFRGLEDEKDAADEGIGEPRYMF